MFVTLSGIVILERLEQFPDTGVLTPDPWLNDMGFRMVVAGKRNVCIYRRFEDELLDAKVCADKVVVDGKIITAKGAGCALDFGFAIVSQVESEAEAERIAKSMQC